MASTSGLRSAAIPWALGLLTACVWLCTGTAGASWILVQGFGIGVFLALGTPLAAGLLRRPVEIARPINVFFLGCIYFFVLDMALLREAEEFQPETVLVAETVITLFLATVIGTWCLVPCRRSPLCAVLERMERDFTGNTYLRIALIAFSLEYLRRLAFVGWSYSQLVHDLLLARAGGAFRRDIVGDWRVFFQPIEVLFLGVIFFADRAWRCEVSRPKKLFLLAVVVLQIGTFILDGDRGKLLIAIMLLLFARAAQQDLAIGRWLRGLVLASFLLAPLMDSMVAVRSRGWSEIFSVEQVSWNIVEAHRDDNFFWAVNLVEFLQRNGGVLAYKGPFGFVEGVREVGWLWLVSPIPRVFWPDKPLATEMGDETRIWNASDSIVGSLLRGGGMTFVIFGGILFGLWLKLLEPLFLLPKSDGAAITYAFLLTVTLSLIRGTAPWNTLPLLLTFSLVVASWRAVACIWRLSTGLALRV